MMILYDTEIRTYVQINKGQTTAAWKKVGLPRFPVGLPNLRGRKWDFLSLEVNGSPDFFYGT